MKTIILLLATSFSITASYAKPFNMSLENNTGIPVTVGISNYNVTPLSLNTTYVPAKTTEVIGLGSSIQKNGAPYAHTSIYAQLGPVKTTDTVSILGYTLDQNGATYTFKQSNLTFDNQTYRVTVDLTQFPKLVYKMDPI